MTNQAYALVLLRIYLGVIFAVAAFGKLKAGAAFAGSLLGFLRFALPNAHPFYAPFLTGAVIPHVATFATLVTVGETFVAIALLSGTLTRVAGVVAMFLLANYMFAKGMWWWMPSSNDGADFAIALALVLAGAGRVFGVDALLAKRWPRLLLW